MGADGAGSRMIWLGALFVLLTCLAAVSPVRCVPYAASQVKVLLDCQKAWGKTFTAWALENAYCPNVTEYGNPFCDAKGMVTSINLGGGNLHGTIPASLGNLISLTYLDLHGNYLARPIPSTIASAACSTWI
ncbi:hypothetical protein CLOM_g966 [Closterium sp. NIES-68]|nr:hypothetical protein CLOM_g966 [Closterium sp. NIES-68]